MAILTYTWGQVRHLFQRAEGLDIPPWAFYIGALLLIIVAFFLAWRNEHLARLKAQASLEDEDQ